MGPKRSWPTSRAAPLAQESRRPKLCVCVSQRGKKAQARSPFQLGQGQLGYGTVVDTSFGLTRTILLHRS